MMRYSVPRNWLFVKDYEFFSFAKNNGWDIGKNTIKRFSGKYSYGMLATRQNILDHPEESARDALKPTPKRSNEKTAEATGDSLGNKIADRIIKVLLQNNNNNKNNNKNKLCNETVTNEHEKEKPKERYISQEEKQKTIDDLRLI